MTWYLAAASKCCIDRLTGGMIPDSFNRKFHQREFIPIGPFSKTYQRHCVGGEKRVMSRLFDEILYNFFL